MPTSKTMPNRPLRRRVATAVSWCSLILSLAAGAVAAADGPARIAARVPAELRVGEPARMEVLLLDERNRLVPAPRELRVVLRGAEPLISGDELRFPAGQEAIAVELLAGKTGAWAVEVIVEGFESVWVPCAALAAEPETGDEREEDRDRAWLLASPGEMPRTVREDQPWARPTTPVGALAAPPRPFLVQPVGTSAESERAEIRRTMGELPAAALESRAALERAVAADPQVREAVADLVAAHRRLEMRSDAAASEAGVARPDPAPDGEAGDPLAGGAAALVLDFDPPRDLRPGLLQSGPLTATDAGDADEPGAPPSAAGELRLIPGEAALGPGADGGYRVQLFGFWYVDGRPATRPEPLELTLVADPPNAELTMEPRQATLAAGEMQTALQLVGRRQGQVELRAFYPGGESSPSRFVFLPPRPERLSLAELPTQVRSVGVAALPVVVRLLDGSGRPTVADRDLAVELSAFGGAETHSQEVILEAGRGEAGATLTLSRFGEQRVHARADGLEGATAPVTMAFDLPILLWALAGSLVGAAVPLLRARRRKDGRRIARDLLLALIAAAVVLLLGAFGLLAVVAEIDPGSLWGALASLPLSNQAAAFLIGFVAGFGADVVFQSLSTWMGQRSR